MRTIAAGYKQFHIRRTVATQAPGSNHSVEIGSSTLTGRADLRLLAIR